MGGKEEKISRDAEEDKEKKAGDSWQGAGVKEEAREDTLNEGKVKQGYGKKRRGKKKRKETE